MSNTEHKRRRLPILLAAAALCTLLPISTSIASAAKGSAHTSGGGSYTVTVSPAGPYTYGEQVTITTNAPAPDGSWMNLACSQNGKLVYTGTHARFSSGWYYGWPFDLGPTISWSGGAADCTATALHQANNKMITDGSTTFHVDA